MLEDLPSTGSAQLYALGSWLLGTISVVGSDLRGADREDGREGAGALAVRVLQQPDSSDGKPRFPGPLRPLPWLHRPWVPGTQGPGVYLPCCLGGLPSPTGVPVPSHRFVNRASAGPSECAICFPGDPGPQTASLGVWKNPTAAERLLSRARTWCVRETMTISRGPWELRRERRPGWTARRRKLLKAFLQQRPFPSPGPWAAWPRTGFSRARSPRSSTARGPSEACLAEAHLAARRPGSPKAGPPAR